MVRLPALPLREMRRGSYRADSLPSGARSFQASTGTERQCVKSENSRGVCTVTTTSGATRDWMVCPFRALDEALLTAAASRIFGPRPANIAAYPVTRLESPDFVQTARTLQEQGKHVSVYFQQKLGGEINISCDAANP